MIRLGIFLALFFILACLESIFPKRKRVQPRKDRWLTNWTLVIIDTLCLRVVAIVIRFVTTLAAFDVALNNWGLMNFLILPTWLEILSSILLLDLQFGRSIFLPIKYQFCGNYTGFIMLIEIWMYQQRFGFILLR